jgi:hypothetical protein
MRAAIPPLPPYVFMAWSSVKEKQRDNFIFTLIQGQEKPISDTFGAVSTFEITLKQVENVNLCHFSPCDLLQKDGSVNVPVPNVRVVEMIISMDENFQMRLNGFS